MKERPVSREFFLSCHLRWISRRCSKLCLSPSAGTSFLSHPLVKNCQFAERLKSHNQAECGAEISAILADAKQGSAKRSISANSRFLRYLSRLWNLAHSSNCSPITALGVKWSNDISRYFFASSKNNLGEVLKKRWEDPLNYTSNKERLED